MSLLLAPEALLDMIIYGCTGFCSTGHCTCMVSLVQMLVNAEMIAITPISHGDLVTLNRATVIQKNFNVYSNELSLCSDYMYIAALLHAD